MSISLRHQDWLFGFAASTALVFLGVAFGRSFVVPAPDHPAPPESFLDSFFCWDGAYYRDIAVHGYSYDPGHQSNIHFFPLYSLVGRAVWRVTGLSPELSLLLTSNLCFAAGLYLLGQYAGLRGTRPRARLYTILSASLLPAGFFFHVAYSESLFFLLCVLTLLLVERRAHPLLVALVVGLATASRPVGVALLPALALYLLRSAKNWPGRVGLALLSLPLSVSGLLFFMAFCRFRFGDPFAFAHNMAHWYMRPPPPLPEKVFDLLGLLPVWTIFDPSSPAYYGKHSPHVGVIFGLYLANPTYFLGAVALLVIGVRNRWLNGYELLTALGLLLIPYWTAGYEVQMTGMARYVSVVVPLYLVAGRLLAKCPPSLAPCLFAVEGAFLAVYAALFVRWYWFV